MSLLSIPHDRPPTRKEAELIIRQLVDSSRIEYSKHCKEKMKEREVTIPEIINCLSKGRVTEDPHLTYQDGGGYKQV